MSDEKHIFLELEPALKWIVDHPGSYPKAVAKRFELNPDILREWIDKNGTPTPGVIEEKRKELGILTVRPAAAAPADGPQAPQKPVMAIVRGAGRKPRALPGVAVIEPTVPTPIHLKLIIEVEVRVRTTQG